MDVEKALITQGTINRDTESILIDIVLKLEKLEKRIEKLEKR
jgi:hypothetical protein